MTISRGYQTDKIVPLVTLAERAKERLRRDEKRPPELVAGRCKHPQRRRGSKGSYYTRQCGNCIGCKMSAHDELVGGALAEAAGSSVVLSLTLTVADCDGVEPDRARRLDYVDVSRMLARIGKKFSVRKIVAGEYCPTSGRPHWHVLLFFQWDAVGQEQWIREFQTQGARMAVVQADWRQTCPPVRLEFNKLSQLEYKRARDDVETLLLFPSSAGRRVKVRQDWKYWPHGLVEVQLVKDPHMYDLLISNKAIRYVVKYFTKDCWKDSKKFKSKTFEALPEFVKQMTGFHQGDKGEWLLGNPYFKALEERENERIRRGFHASADEIPIGDRLYRSSNHKSPNGGLGNLYFKALGVYHAGLGEQFMDRSYRIDGATKGFNEVELRRRFAKGWDVKTNRSNTHWRYQMGDTAYLHYGRAFNSELIRLGKDAAWGRDYSYEALEERRAEQRLRAQGAFGYSLWKNASSIGERLKLERQWANVSNDKLKGIVPEDYILRFEQNSPYEGWKRKRRARALAEAYGPVAKVFQISDLDRLVLTKDKRLIFERTLSGADIWWHREIETVEQLQSAERGDLLPVNARIVRLEQEGQGDQRRLDSFKSGALRRRLNKLQVIPF